MSRLTIRGGRVDKSTLEVLLVMGKSEDDGILIDQYHSQAYQLIVTSRIWCKEDRGKRKGGGKEREACIRLFMLNHRRSFQNGA